MKKMLVKEVSQVLKKAGHVLGCRLNDITLIAEESKILITIWASIETSVGTELRTLDFEIVPRYTNHEEFHLNVEAETRTETPDDE